MHLPLQRYFADNVLSGRLPFWTPYLFSGYPLLANPEVGAWYAPHWPFFLAGVTPLAIQMELVFNAFIACLGAYLLLSGMVASRSAAIMGALFYGLSGFFAGHSSHVGIFSAAGWFPWLLLAYRRAAGSAVVLYTALGAMAGGLMILAGYAQTAMFGFLGLGFYALSDMAFGKTRPVRAAGIVAGMFTGALAIAAIQILPALELAGHSIRAAFEYSTSTEGVLKPAALVTLLAPDALGALSGKYTGPPDITQYYFYAGLLLLPLAALGAVKTRMRMAALPMLLLTCWYMLGPAAGLYRLGALVPGMHRFRAPVQGWFVAAMALALLAAAGSDWLFARWRMPSLKVALVVIVFADLWYWNSLANPLAYARNSFASTYGANEEAGGRKVAATQPPLTRFDGPRYFAGMGPLDHPLDVKLEATYGYFAMEPAAYDEYAEAMTRNPKLRDGLNVGRVLNVNTGALEPNPAVLPRAYFPKAVEDVGSAAGSKRALEALDPATSSLVSVPHAPIRQDTDAAATVIHSGEQSYSVRYRAASPSLLKLSVVWFPGWRATMGGAELPILRVDHALMGVVVPAGTGDVEFRFRSNYFPAGRAITLVSVLGLAALAWKGGHGGRQRAA